MGTRAVGAPVGVTPASPSRARLLSVLDHATERRLTTIVAPAGYGKTVVLTEWTTARDDPVVWLTLRPVHNRSRRLTADLDAAARVLEGASLAVLVLDDFHVLT